MDSSDKKNQLILKYKNIVCGCDKKESQFHWLWYLKELWKADKSPDIFRELQWIPRNNGLRVIYAYLDNEINLKQLYNELKFNSAYLYIYKLIDNEIINIRSKKEYEDLSERLVLECLVQFYNLKEINMTYEERIKKVCSIACTVWFHFIDDVHKVYNLPDVKDLKNILNPQSFEEQIVQKDHNFNIYELTQEEKLKIKELLDL